MNIRYVQARNYHKGRLNKIKLIVVHDMEAPERTGTALSVANYFARANAPEASAHYAIDPTTIIQCVKDEDTAWHAPGANSNGLGIEHAGYAKQDRRGWTDTDSVKILTLSAKLTARLARKYGIPIKHLTDAELAAGKAGFIGHDQASRVFKQSTHTDPGKAFPWDVYMRMVQAEYDALTGHPWARSAIAAAAVATGVAAAVFAGITQQATTTPAKPPAATSTAAPHATTPAKTTATPPTTKPATTTRARATVRRGSTGPLVRIVQRAVGASVDGVFGPKTEAKVKAFQRKHGLVADGVVGPKTWAKIR